MDIWEKTFPRNVEAEAGREAINKCSSKQVAKRNETRRGKEEDRSTNKFVWKSSR